MPVFYLTETQSYFGYVEQVRTPQFIERAIVMVSGNGQSETLQEGFRYDTLVCGSVITGDSTLVRYYKGNIPLEIGKEYTLNISHNGRVVSALMTIPSPIEIHHLEETRIKDPQKNDTLVNVSVFIQDEAGIQNYYRMARAFKARAICKDALTGEKDTLFYDMIRYSRVFTDITKDVNMDGGLIERKFSLRQSSVFSEGLSFSLQHLSPELGRYLMSLREQEKDYDYLPDDLPDFLDPLFPDSLPDPFVEPTTLKSNITGGIGCFGGASVSESVSVRMH